MLTNYLRELLKPIIYQCMNENELTVSNRYIADMSDAIDTAALARDISYNLDIAPVEFEEADLEEIAHKISKYLNTNDRIDTLERKMDLILKHLGITPENA